MPTRSQRHKEEIQGGAIVAAPVIEAWVAGANTVTPVVIASGKAKNQRLGAGNPRISKMVTGLVGGKTYRVDTVHTVGTAVGNAIYRASDTSGIWSGTYGEATVAATGPVSFTFVAPAGGVVYIGFEQVAATDGLFAETKDVFTLTRTN